MSTDELGKRELEILADIDRFEGSPDEKSDWAVYTGITKEYKQIHTEYSKLAKKDGEALKRGLFIMWYAITEPTWLTGINELDFEAEERIAKLLNRRLAKNISDYELDWMLEYYADFGFKFDHLNEYEEFYRRTSSKTGLEFPDAIDKEVMANRGQMGEYFSSIDIGQWNKHR